MIRRTGLFALTAGLALIFLNASLAAPCTLVNGECFPGRIRNPTAGLEQFQDIAYNSAQDHYLVVYKGGSPRGLILTPAGSVGSEIIFGPASPSTIQEISVDYNPDRDEFLVAWRYDSNLAVWARYLAGDGTPIGAPFFIGSPGTEPRVAYSTGSQRYVVVYSGIGLGTAYRAVHGDSTVATPVIGGGVIDNTAFSARVAYGSTSNKFLIVYTRDFSPNIAKADVWGIFLDGSGFGFGGAFGIGTGNIDQQLPEVGYSPVNDEFMVAFEDWSAGSLPDVRFHLVSSGGAVGARKNLTPGDPGWNVPGPIGYNPLSNEFIATYFDGLVSGWAREVKPGTGALDTLTKFGALNSVPLGIAVRPDAVEPQAAVVWRNFLGADGVHVSFLQLEVPPPVISNTTMPSGGKNVAYSQAVQVQGGKQPLSFSLVSGSLPPGLSGPNASTGVISGTPTTIGTYVFRVRVQDNEGRADEKDITLQITLAAPTLISPMTATNNPRPTFQWTASPTATSYTLVVENLTDGGVVINQAGIGTTSFTPGSDLPSGKTYRWKVQASDGTNLSPFSAQVSFLLDSVPPSQVTNLSGVPAVEMKLAGLGAIETSGQLPGGYGPERTLDGNFTTEYTSPGRSSGTFNEYIVYDLGATRTVGRVRLRSRNFFGDLMPRDFVIEWSNSPSSGFVAATTVTNFVAPTSPDQWFTFNFTPVTARYLKLRVTKMNAYSGNGQFYVSFTEFEAWQTAPLGSLQLTWTPPDPNVGTLVSYDIRYTTAATFNYASATPLGVISANLGSPATLLVANLTPETIHRFGLTATDNAGNVSAVSNVAVVTSKGFPPDAVDDLAASNATLNSIDLSWKAPQDPPSGGAANSYEIRYSTSMITAANFDAALPVQGTVPTPGAPNSNQGMTVTGLTPNTPYYFAMKSLDGGLNKSDISNVVSFSTLDNVPPDAATAFTVMFTDDDTVDVSWKASGDDGTVGIATAFDIRYRTDVPITEANFGGSSTVSGEPTPLAFGTVQSMTIEGLTPGTLHYIGIKVLDEQNNASPLATVNATTIADLAEPVMVSPAAGATLTGSTQTFQWAPNGLAATQWWVYMGTARGKKDLHDSGNLGTTTSRFVTGLPTNGSTVWLRLWYFAGVWGYEDFQFTAYTPPPPPPPPAITSPTPGSTLAGASVAFQWTGNGAAVTEWWVYAGSTAGASNYFSSGSLGTATSVTVTGLPTNGSTVHVRLWYRIAGLWGSQDFQYTAATGGGGGSPAVTSPANGSTLGGTTQLFQWSANGAAVTEWWLYVGRSSNASDIFNSGSLGAATTQVNVTGLPSDGSQVYVRLWFRVAGLWQFSDTQYTATNIAGGGTPAITSPAGGSTLTGASQIVQWSANGAAVTEWWLYAGSTVGGKQYFDSGSLGTAVQVNVTGLPVNGSTIYVRLFYRIGGVWQSLDVQYTAANLAPLMTSPAPGSTLAGTSQLFQWSANGVTVTEWWLYAGSAAGLADYYNSGTLGTATSVTATGLPAGGVTIHVTLWYRVAGLWKSVAFQYTAAP